MSILDSTLEMPESTLEAIRAYVAEHRPPGRFLEALLENNLLEAVLRADYEERQGLAEIVLYCYGDIPARCWQSHEKVQAWLKAKSEEPEKVR